MRSIHQLTIKLKPMKNPIQSILTVGKIYMYRFFLHIPFIQRAHAHPSTLGHLDLNAITSKSSSKEIPPVSVFSAIEQVVTGTVTDQSGEPLPGVTVSVDGTTTGTATDIDGKYSLAVPEGSTLVFSFIGFESQRIAVGSRTVIDIVLVEDISSLEEVVVVGYGTQRKADLTGSVAVVNVREMQAQPAASPIEGLQGKATGVHIINTGAPGATPQIRIRGFSTINNNNPLYIIDGVPFEGKLSWLNASDIESMQVLKDASASSIYGARANNGVVLITTKSGQPGDPQISFDMYYGTQTPNMSRFPKFLNPQQYAEYVYQRYTNAGKTPGLSGTTGSNYGSDPRTPVLPDYLLAGTKTGHNITSADV